MVSWIISRLVVLIFGTLYPAYSSYKAVKSKDVREYVKWMMYWIIFALFTTVEVITDIFLCWLPFYYELKIAFVVWLLSPYTKGSSVLYRKFVHPTLSSKEKDIDEYLCQAKDKSYDTLMHFGRKGLNVAATAAVMAATKGQGVLSERLRSFSMQDLSSFQAEGQTNSASSVTTQPAAAQHRTRTMMRSKSETGYSKGHDFDMTEYELLNLEQSKEPPIPPTPTPILTLSQPNLPQTEPVTPLPSPPESQDQSSPPTVASEEPQEKEDFISSSPQFRFKRRAPEPPPRPLRPFTRSRSKNALSSDTEAM
ncbi:receptor expression-enhancing protein 1 isoform X1 [Danio rerio]|uniref:Receptor expression-enhancing protein n=1 Tax=Danio rerio TaxID=7955 RepID=A0A8M9P9M3_DANRE|nr:receptor expression-enhancing protein 1-like isoform X1 [Danio rerio]|eukprot:XP_021323143.1 receptor expression-enhancing protein 1-like isoform X1 [Danio rerio]